MKKTIIITLITFIIFLISIISSFVIKGKNNKKRYYKRLFFLRKSELKFLKTISVLENEYIIIPKLSLRKIIKTDNKKYKKELKNMTVDYAIFNKDYSSVILLIELSYKSDNIDNQVKIDKLKDICKDAEIKFITFQANSNKENEKEIIDKIKEIIKENI